MEGEYYWFTNPTGAYTMYIHTNLIKIVDIGYRNMVGGKICSYIRYVLITDMFLYPICSYIRYILISDMFL